MKVLSVLVGLVMWVCLVLIKALNFVKNLVMLVGLDCMLVCGSVVFFLVRK